MRAILPPENLGTFFPHPVSPNIVTIRSIPAVPIAAPKAIITPTTTKTVTAPTAAAPVYALPQPRIPTAAPVAQTPATPVTIPRPVASVPTPATPQNGTAAPAPATLIPIPTQFQQPTSYVSATGAPLTETTAAPFPWLLVLIVIVGALIVSRSS